MAAAFVLTAYLVWGLRSLIVPAAVGGLLAYICRPVVARLERGWIPRGLAVGLLLVMFAVAGLVAASSLRAAMPSETDALDLRVRALYALHDRYRALMGRDPSGTGGNSLYRLAHRDLDPLMDRVSELLALTAEERALFLASHARGADAASGRSKRLLEYERANAQGLEMRGRRTGRVSRTDGVRRRPAEPPADRWGAGRGGRARPHPVELDDHALDLSVPPARYRGHQTWPAQRVPNRLFEPALAVLADVDETLGGYVRGIFLECCALGLTVMVMLILVGVPLRWAIAIGIFRAPPT